MDKYRLDALKVTQYHNFPYLKDGKWKANFKRTGEDTFLGFVANCITGFWFGAEYWQSLRETKQVDEDRYKHLKSFLPAYTLCAEYSHKRELEYFTAYNNLIGVDIDPGHNPHITDWPMIRDKFFNAWPEVVLSALSASGQGVFMVFALQKTKAETHDQHKADHERFYYGLERAFAKYDIKIDGACKDIPRLRFATYDPDLKYRAIIQKEFALPAEPQKKAIQTRKITGITKGANDPILHGVNAANKRWGPFSDGNKHVWINTATHVMKQNGVSDAERKSFIDNNILDLTQITTNCLQ